MTTKERIWNSLMNVWRVFLSRHRVITECDLEDLQEQLDYLKSRQEISYELFEEMWAWKKANPIPANPKVSVCVTTYNRPELLTERCIASILGQTYKNLELIVVGDGAGEATVRAMARIRDPRVRFVNLAQRGLYPDEPEFRWMVAGYFPSVRALEMASGDFITHLDDDDAYAPERLETLLDFSAETGCDLVFHPFWYQDGQGRWCVNEASRFAYAQVTSSSVFYRSWFRRVPFDLHAWLLREPGDWSRMRRFKFLGAKMARCPHLLTWHYRERTAGS